MPCVRHMATYDMLVCEWRRVVAKIRSGACATHGTTGAKATRGVNKAYGVTCVQGFVACGTDVHC